MAHRRHLFSLVRRVGREDATEASRSILQAGEISGDDSKPEARVLRDEQRHLVASDAWQRLRRATGKSSPCVTWNG